MDSGTYVLSRNPLLLSIKLYKTSMLNNKRNWDNRLKQKRIKPSNLSNKKMNENSAPINYSPNLCREQNDCMKVNGIIDSIIQR